MPLCSAVEPGVELAETGASWPTGLETAAATPAAPSACGCTPASAARRRRRGPGRGSALSAARVAGSALPAFIACELRRSPRRAGRSTPARAAVRAASAVADAPMSVGQLLERPAGPALTGSAAWPSPPESCWEPVERLRRAVAAARSRRSARALSPPEIFAAPRACLVEAGAQLPGAAGGCRSRCLQLAGAARRRSPRPVAQLRRARAGLAESVLRACRGRFLPPLSSLAEFFSLGRQRLEVAGSARRTRRARRPSPRAGHAPDGAGRRVDVAQQRRRR